MSTIEQLSTSKKRGCPTCNGVDPKSCLRCKGRTRLCDWYNTDCGWVFVPAITIEAGRKE